MGTGIQKRPVVFSVNKTRHFTIVPKTDIVQAIKLASSYLTAIVRPWLKLTTSGGSADEI